MEIFTKQKKTYVLLDHHNILDDTFDRKMQNIKEMTCIIPAEKILVYNFTMPRIDNRHREEAVLWELDCRLPFSLDRVYVDWVVEEERCLDPDIMHVYALAMPKKFIDNGLKKIARKNIRIDSLESEQLHYLRANNYLTFNRKTVIIAIGEKKTLMMIVHQKRMCVSVTVPFSKAMIIHKIREELHLDKKKAEKIVEIYGIGKKSSEMPLLRAVDPLLKNLLYIIRQFVLAHDRSGVSKIHDIVVDTDIKELSEYIKKDFVLMQQI